jgi:hypothetical protein
MQKEVAAMMRKFGNYYTNGSKAGRQASFFRQRLDGHVSSFAGENRQEG